MERAGGSVLFSHKEKLPARAPLGQVCAYKSPAETEWTLSEVLPHVGCSGLTGGRSGCPQ